MQSEYGQGSRFTFEIDLQELTCEHALTMFEGKRVLIIDDNPAWHGIIADMLQRFKLVVEHASGGDEALEKIRSPYDLILIDRDMPGGDGFKTWEMIKHACGADCRAPVMMVDEWVDEPLAEKMQRVGITIHVQKPFNPSTLNDALTSAFFGKVQHKPADKTIELKKDVDTLVGATILLAEDHLTNRIIVQGLLEDSGITIDMAENGQEAVDLFLQNPDRYDLMLVDIQMPLLDGFEVTRRIRVTNSKIPVIALTASAMKEDVERAAQAGMNEQQADRSGETVRRAAALYSESLIRWTARFKRRFKHRHLCGRLSVKPGAQSLLVSLSGGGTGKKILLDKYPELSIPFPTNTFHVKI